ncbi:MAG: aminoglycoside phosphotransferase family protein [Aggregatilineales bacterium]
MTALTDTWIQSHLDSPVHAIEKVQDGAVGAVWRVLTETNSYYFKTCAEGFRHEVPLMHYLAEHFPADIPVVLGADIERGWLLIADAGTPLRTQIRETENFALLEGMMRQYARFQQATIPHLEPLLEYVPDRRADKLAALYKDLISDEKLLLVGQENGVTVEELMLLQALDIDALCQKLADSPLPNTLHHDDFHDNNAAIKDDNIRFFDFGEACIAHPFFSLMVILRVAKYLHKLDDAMLNQLRDAYLSEWTDYAPLDALREEAAGALRLAALCRALTWRDLVRYGDAKHIEEDLDAPPYWLMTFFYDTPMAIEYKQT